MEQRATYRLPFLNLRREIARNSEILNVLPFRREEIPFENGEIGYGTNEWSSFYFELPREMPIAASRAGRVVEQEVDKRHRRRLVPHRTNYMILDHGDGTYAKYVHVISEVNKGAIIEAGERMGMLSGYRKKHHLHFYILKRGWGIVPPWPKLRKVMLCSDDDLEYVLNDFQ